MELSGKIIAVLPAKTGNSAKGAWVSQEYVIEDDSQYKKKMMFGVFGQEKIQSFALHVGDDVKVFFDIDAREYNGKWYNDLRAWKVDHVQSVRHAGGMPF